MELTSEPKVKQMGLYQHLKETFEAQYKTRSPEYKARLMEWNKVPHITRVEKPTNLARARELGYKAKTGFVIARVRVRKGRRKRKQPQNGRKPSKSGHFFSRAKSLQWIAEEKATKSFPNLEVLNSYWIGETGDTKYFEIIMVDANTPTIKSDKTVAWIASSRGRAERGLTSAGKKGRGLKVGKGKGSEKTRPSIGAWRKRGK